LADRAPVAVFISGSGTNMAALLYASRAENCPYRIVLVLSNNPDASGLKLAEAEGVATFCLPHKGIARADHDAAMEAEVVRAGARFIALADTCASFPRIRRPLGRPDAEHPPLAAAEIQGPARTIARSRRATATAAARSISSPPNSTTARSSARRRWRSCRAIPATLAARVLIAEHQLYSRVLADFVTRETAPDYLVAQCANAPWRCPRRTKSPATACLASA
jgi:phosphoribosylglycinamide formyltransferase-1